MLEHVILSLITAIPPTLAVIFAFLSNKKRLTQIHVDINSRVDELVKLTQKASFAEGKLSEKDNNES